MELNDFIEKFAEQFEETEKLYLILIHALRN